MENKNALQISTQYPVEQYNLLVPMQTVAEIAEIHKPVMNVVKISTKQEDKEIYLQEKGKDSWVGKDGKKYPAKVDGWALTKKGLNKLMRAAGIKILGTRPVIPSTCQKCSEVNKSIGRPVNCGVCGNKDVKFETYASLRIRGSILDQIRKMDWIPRTVRQKQKKIDEAIRKVETRTGKTASDEEIAKELEVSNEELINWQSQLKITNMVSLNEYVEQGMEPTMDARGNSHFIQPEDAIAEEELKKVLEQSLEVLTEKERKVITLYYYEDLTLKEISNVLEVSESRISQLHTKALMKMKKTMGPYMNILTD